MFAVPLLDNREMSIVDDIWDEHFATVENNGKFRYISGEEKEQNNTKRIVIDSSRQFGLMNFDYSKGS